MTMKKAFIASVIMEKKTAAEYRERQFKKQYKYTKNPDDPTGNTGWITVNGEKFEVKLKDNKILGMGTCAELEGGGIVVDIDRLKKIRGSKLREAILQHEIGHLKLHTRTPQDSPHLRRDMMNKKIHTDVVMNHGIDVKDPITGKPAMDAAGRDFRKMTGIKEYFKTGKENKELTKKRVDYRNSVRKHSERTNHTNTNEFEADQYAANRVGSKNMIKSVRKLSSLQETEGEKLLKSAKSSRKGIAEAFGKDSGILKAYNQNIAAARAAIPEQKKQLRTALEKDVRKRKEVLNDKSVKNTSRNIF